MRSIRGRLRSKHRGDWNARRMVTKHWRDASGTVTPVNCLLRDRCNPAPRTERHRTKYATSCASAGLGTSSRHAMLSITDSGTCRSRSRLRRNVS